MRLITRIQQACVSLMLVASAMSLNAESVLMSAREVGGLAGALRSALENNPAVLGKKAELAAQRYAVDVTRAGRYPSMSVSANNISEEFDDQGTVRLQQPLYAFGRINSAIDEAQARYLAEEWDLLRIQRQLIEDTATAYARIDGARQRGVLAQQNIDEQQVLYERIARREHGQLASEADVRLANSRLIQARALKQRVDGELKVALAELRALTLVDSGASEPITTGLIAAPAEPVELALERSAEIAFKREQLEVARHGVRREKLESMPTVYLRAEYDFLDQQQSADPGRIGVAIESTLDGMGLATRGRVRGASARLDAAQQDLRLSVEDVRRRIGVLKVNRDTTLTLLESQREAVTAVAATLDSFVRQYETGRKSWVEVLNTQRELSTLRFELSQLDNDGLVLSARIAAATGSLDELAGISMPGAQ